MAYPGIETIRDLYEMSATAEPLPDELTCVSKPLHPEELDADGYLEANPDVTTAGLDPLEHFLTTGKAEGRTQAVNRTEIKTLREAKLAQLLFRIEPQGSRTHGQPIRFLSDDVIEEFAIPDLPPVSAHPYSPLIVELIRKNPDKLFLDVGAGLRATYYTNVVNTEIYPSVSTDVICVGEALPFADEQFDFVFCFATLEHTRRPWDVAREICRVLKTGGTAIIDYPFMQPVHGYPHHYFNATPAGNQSLFEPYCEIRSLEIGYHHHPMIGLQWVLTVFRNGLPAPDADRFGQLRVIDIVDRPVDALITESYCRNLHPHMQEVIASGSLLQAVKLPLSPVQASAASAVNLPLSPVQASAATKVASLTRENEFLRLQLQSMRTSTSWRVSAPLRFVARLLRRGGN